MKHYRVIDCDRDAFAVEAHLNELAERGYRLVPILLPDPVAGAERSKPRLILELDVEPPTKVASVVKLEPPVARDTDPGESA